MDESDIYAFLAQHKLGVLSTFSSNTGSPQSAVVGIAVTAQLEIIFDTVNTTRKHPNLIARPACSFVVWDGAQTVQYEGEAEQLSPPALERYQDVYFQAWPDGTDWLSWPGIVYFLVRPKWVRYSDFSHTPPLIREFTFS